MPSPRNVLNTAVLMPQQVRMARAAAVSSQRRIIEELEDQTGLDADLFAMALGNTFHYPVYSMDRMRAMTPAFDVLQFSEAQERECIALRDDSGRLILVIADPFDIGLQGWAEQRIQSDFSWGLAHRTDVAGYLAGYEDTLLAMDSLKASGEKTVDIGEDVEDLSLRAINEDTSPVIKLVNSTVYDALKVSASDIHLESGPAGLTIKYRIDGVLTAVGSVGGQRMAEEVISRIKVISELDISESRVPQDGRFKVSVRGREIDLRVSIMPSIFGEDAVLRILDKKTLSNQLEGLRLSNLGFDEHSITMMRHLANEPYGMMLVTGPTGSGKTTTLYAALTEINHGEDKIITIEDPVEYQLPGVLQIPVNEKKGLTFALGLRSILRHDPDKIMVGEIRDPETAQIAVQSALTGHLVFTTVHANNVFDVIGRFMHMGVDPYSFVSALNGILAQRLVRVNCPHCSIEDHPSATLLADSGLDEQTAATMHFRVGKGCEHCRGTGFKGRRAIAEILTLNDEIRELIIARQPLRILREAAKRNGTRFLREIALDMVASGESTLQEINRATFVIR